MAKSAEERFDIAVEAYEHFSKSLALMAEAGVYNNGMAKSVGDIVAALASGMMILDPDKYDEYAKNAVKEYEKKVAQAQVQQHTNGFVGVDRPAGGMYASAEGWSSNRTPEGGYL